MQTRSHHNQLQLRETNVLSVNGSSETNKQQATERKKSESRCGFSFFADAHNRFLELRNKCVCARARPCTLNTNTPLSVDATQIRIPTRHGMHLMISAKKNNSIALSGVAEDAEKRKLNKLEQTT